VGDGDRDHLGRLVGKDGKPGFETVLAASSSDPADYPRVWLAHSTEPVELRSLETVAEALRQYQSWSEAPLPAATKVELFCCSGCGATLVPSDSDEVECQHCSAVTRVPARLRERMREHDQASSGAHVEELARLLSSTRLGRTRLLIAVGGALILGAWPLAVWLVRAGVTDGSLVRSGLLYAVVPMLIVPTYCALRLQLVDRIALPAVFLSCAVAGPDTTCGDCLGPLPRRANEALVGCVYCGAENMLDLDLRPRAAAVTRSRALVFEALERRSAERQRWERALRSSSWLLLGAAVALAVALLKR
jgi:hypothetical protein